MNILSLFDGISCAQIALERAGIKFDKYFSSEIDKYAIKITQSNYPDTIQLGDIKNWREWDIDFSKIDYLFAGFPCQSWSLSGKQKGDNDPRGALVHVLIEIWQETKKHNPNLIYLFENVKMKKEFMDYIDSLFGVEHIEINSSLVSAQNRKRIYYTNIPDIKQPKDKKIYLADILETGITDRDKSYCIDANYFKGGNLKSYFEKHRRQLIFSKEGLCHVGDADVRGFDSNKRVYHPRGKSPTVTSCSGENREPKILCGAWRGRYVVDGKRQDSKMKTAGLTTQRLEVRQDGKTNALTTVQKDNSIVDINDLTWRKLTPLEYERLQTIPDLYTSYVSNSQRYKAIGNSFTVDVIVHILKHIRKHLNENKNRKLK